MRLLLVEGDEERGSAMRAALSRAGFATDWVRTSDHMQVALSTHAYDCTVLGLPVADMAQETLLPSVRRGRALMPVILVTDAGSHEDCVALLDQGADDCLVRPFHLAELIARVRSLMRRTRSEGPVEDPLIYGSIRLDARNLCAQWVRGRVKLTQSEFVLLETLIRKRNLVLSRAQLEESLYSWGEEVHSNAVEVYVHHLRRKFYPGLIVTVRGLGYRLTTEPL